MSRWRVEVSETIEQSSVYIIDAETEEQAKSIAHTEEGEMEQLSYYTEERKVNSILSIELYPF
ncbi:MAG: hypothetical protein Q8L88_00520 [Bacteroidota bacterium]|nr:hypothetical protein [Bacteroidota bacterium]